MRQSWHEIEVANHKYVIEVEIEQEEYIPFASLGHEGSPCCRDRYSLSIHKKSEYVPFVAHAEHYFYSFDGCKQFLQLHEIDVENGWTPIDDWEEKHV